MTTRPVITTEAIHYGPASDWELDKGIRHAKEKYGREIQSYWLRVVFNTVLHERKPDSNLPLLTATQVRKVIPAKDKELRHCVDAYKGAVMKIFSDRSAARRAKFARLKKNKVQEARKRRQGVAPTTPAPKKRRAHPEDPKKPKQLLLL